MTRKLLLSAAMALALTTPIASVRAQQTLNVRDADIRAFIQDAARVTGRTFIIDNKVQGKVSVVTDRPLSRSEYFEIFLSTLRANGLVMLLPHGYEGQGPEHSSARLERFLQLCANDNIQVCNITMPHNYFHVLRRQMMRPFRKPLIIMTPKSLLRHPMAKSPASMFMGDSQFKRILSDNKEIADEKVKRLVLCSGKVAFDLMEKRDEEGLEDVSIVRIEQLYPFPGDPLAVRLERMTNLESVVWCQEEPRNNGAWFFVNERIEASLAAAGKDGMRPTYAGREEAASPATGLAKRHQAQQEALVTIALGLADGGEAKRALKKKESAEKKV